MYPSLATEQNIAIQEVVTAMVVEKPVSTIANHTQIKGSVTIIEAVYARKIESGQVGSTVTTPNLAGFENVVESEEF